MTENLESLRKLRQVLMRLGARQTGRYWSNAFSVFLSNVLGGAAAGAAAFILAAILLGLDIHRGENSVLYHAVRAVQTIIETIRTQIQQELY